MKYSKYILFSCLVGLALWSCKDEVFDPSVKLNTAPAITTPAGGTSYVLNSAEGDSLIPAISWTAADFGYDAGVEYTVQVDVAGNNFAEAVTLGVVHSLDLATLTQAGLNSILLAKDLEAETPQDLEIRVVANIGSGVEHLISAPLALKVTPYPGILIFDQLQVPGSYQGWDPANNNTIIYSAKNDGAYEGYVYFQDVNALFKYTKGLNWDVNYGDDGADGTLDPNGANLEITDAGIYHLKVNLNTLSHSYEAANWGLIGSATPGGWDNDTDMTYDAVSGKICVTLDLVPGDIKFRANDGWDLNYGDDGNNKSLEFNGANIAVAQAGNYTVCLLIVRAAKFKYEITKN